ncbi:MAG: hypothetical protein ACTHU0_27145, partial [Kofleriaceae bacterium]
NSYACVHADSAVARGYVLGVPATTQRTDVGSEAMRTRETILMGVLAAMGAGACGGGNSGPAMEPTRPLDPDDQGIPDPQSKLPVAPKPEPPVVREQASTTSKPAYWKEGDVTVVVVDHDFWCFKQTDNEPCFVSQDRCINARAAIARPGADACAQRSSAGCFTSRHVLSGEPAVDCWSSMRQCQRAHGARSVDPDFGQVLPCVAARSGTTKDRRSDASGLDGSTVKRHVVERGVDVLIIGARPSCFTSELGEVCAQTTARCSNVAAGLNRPDAKCVDSNEMACFTKKRAANDSGGALCFGSIALCDVVRETMVNDPGPTPSKCLIMRYEP